MVEISVVVPIYNALEDVKILLDSLVKNFDFSIGEVILLNDCSDNETSLFLQKFSNANNQFKLFNNKENLGFIKTCNRGLKESNGRIIVLLNSDTMIPADFTQRIIDCFNSNEKIGIASPIGSHTADYFVTMPEKYNIEDMNKILKDKHKCVYPEVPSCEGFCFCIRREVIEQNGYLDEIYGAGYCEEVDYSYRAIDNGWLNVLIDNLYVYHKRQASFGSDRREKLYKKNLKIFNKRWKSFREDYIKKNNFKNPIRKIRKEMFTFEHYYKKLKKGLLSKEAIDNKRILRVLGIKFSYKKNNKVVYTCITGDYDELLDVKSVGKGWDYICFTDNKILLKKKKHGVWKIKPLVFDEMDNVRNARYHKILGPLFLDKYKFSIWVDSNIQITGEYIYDLVEGNLAKPMLVPVHHLRNCIYDEIDACLNLNKDSKDIILKQKKFLKLEGMPKKYGLCETNIIYRRHDNLLIKGIMQEWWNLVKKYSRRDQLSFTYVMWKHNIELFQIIFANCSVDGKNLKKYKHGEYKRIYRCLNLKLIMTYLGGGRTFKLVSRPSALQHKVKINIRNKNILLISHNLYYEGAPISLFLIAKILKNNNFNVEVLSPIDGDLHKKYLDFGIPVKIMPNFENKKSKFINHCKKFDLIIANTILTYKAVDFIKNIKPVIWFIREAENIKDYCMSRQGLSKSIRSCKSIYAVSEYAKKIIDKEFKQDVSVMHNFCEDLLCGKNVINDNKISFSYVGTMIPRKGLNILIDAFINLNKKYKDKIELNIIGELSEDKEDFWSELQEKTEKHNNIIWRGRVTGINKKTLFEQTNVFVIPSLDEASSRVVLEACMMKRPVIVTENVGAKYMLGSNNECGWMVKSNDAEDLTICIEKIILSPNCIEEKGRNARQKYLETSTKQIYEKKLLKIVENAVK